jgi:hypothetical protein
MYRDYISSMGYTVVSKDKEEILYWDDNGTGRHDDTIFSMMSVFCRRLFKTYSGICLRKIRIALKSSKFVPVIKGDQIIGFNEHIETDTIFTCDPKTPRVFKFISVLEYAKIIVTKLDQPIPDTAESRIVSYRTHQASYRLMCPEIMEEPIEIPENR